MTDWKTRLDPKQALLVTGAAGFIGHRVSEMLLKSGRRVIGFDNLNDYYDPALKQDRLLSLSQYPGFNFVHADLADSGAVERVFSRYTPKFVVHLAAQAGVRYSLENPRAYIDSNLVGFLNILEGCRAHDVAHLVYASSSSVYGGNRKTPFDERDPVNHPVSLYAATKKSNELMAHSYAHLYGIPMTGLRFFTVYGPWGRPDMAYYKFAVAIMKGEPIKVFNHGDMRRDFTYIDDVAEGVLRCVPEITAPDPRFDPKQPNPATSWAPHRVYNIGNRRSENLLDMIAMLEGALGREAKKEFLPMQPGDVKETWASVDDLEAAVGFRPDTPLNIGLERFARWFLAYYADDGQLAARA